MLEPTIIRQIATLTEWDGTTGYATTDDGKIFPLKLNNMYRDLLGWLPEKGARVELYLHQNEHGEMAFVECCAMPLSGQNRDFYIKNQVYENIEGQKFYVNGDLSPIHFGKEFCACVIGLAFFVILGWFHSGNVLELTGSILVCLICMLIDIWNRRRKNSNPKNWLFTLNNQGIVFQIYMQQEGYLAFWRSWSDIKHFSLEKSMFFKQPYWQIECHSAVLGKHNIPLNQLSANERELANKMAQAYFSGSLQNHSN